MSDSSFNKPHGSHDGTDAVLLTERFKQEGVSSTTVLYDYVDKLNGPTRQVIADAINAETNK